MGDADLLIVQSAVECSYSAHTVIVGDDTDLLILLFYHAIRDDCHDIFFKPERKMGSKKLPKYWNIKLTKAALGNHVCENILFIHAFLGCDTTSRVLVWEK